MTPQGAPRALVLASLVLLATLVAGVATAMTEPKRQFPALTGRIVDGANIIPADTKAKIEAKLSALEAKSGIQLVVATVKSLGGSDIESYANELFRFWKLGEAKNNNGVLLLVALDDRKVRIEPGYGLEGMLTDAASSLIIANAIAPRFKAKDYGGGVERGVDDIITTLSSDSDEWAKRPRERPEARASWLDVMTPFIFMGIVILVMIYLQRNTGAPGGRLSRGRGGSVFIPTPIDSGSSGGGGFSGGFSGSGDSGGGFSGGGGSSGGGGASGSW